MAAFVGTAVVGVDTASRFSAIETAKERSISLRVSGFLAAMEEHLDWMSVVCEVM